jgi:hypothetical protein
VQVEHLAPEMGPARDFGDAASIKRVVTSIGVGLEEASKPRKMGLRMCTGAVCREAIPCRRRGCVAGCAVVDCVDPSPPGRGASDGQSYTRRQLDADLPRGPGVRWRLDGRRRQHHGRLADQDFGKCGLRPGRYAAQCTRHRLAPQSVDCAAADLVTLERRADRPIRPKRITQDCQLLLDRPAASTGYRTDNLDTTTRTTDRMTTRYTCRWFDSIVRHHGPVQRAAINPSNAPPTRRPSDCAYSIGDGVQLNVHTPFGASDEAPKAPFLTRRLDAVRRVFR